MINQCKNLTSMSRSSKVWRVAFSALMALVMMLISSVTLAVTAHADGALSALDLYRATAYWKGHELSGVSLDSEDAPNDLPSWGALTELHNAGAPDKNVADNEKDYRNWVTLDSFYKAFGSSSSYAKATEGLRSFVYYDDSTDTLKCVAGMKETAYSKAISDFNSSVVSQQAESMFREIYDMSEWNPNAGQAANFLATVYKVVNTVFYVVAQCLMWFFIGQSTFDMIYLVFEPIRPFLGPKDSGVGGAGANNGAGGFLSKLRIPLASKAAAAAANSDGGAGGNNGGGSGMNMFLVYALKRFPVLLMCAVYIILVANGYWTKVISWVAGFVCQIFNFFLNM